MRQPRPRRTPPAPGRGAHRGLTPPPPATRWRADGAVRFAVVVLAGVAAALGVLLAGVAASGPAEAAPPCAGPLADGQIRVVIVVDPGETGPRAPSATCLVVQAGAAGSKILAQRAAQLGLPAPRYAGSGLLCGLDGFPETACPVNTGGAYAYWAYFNGSGGAWSYGHDNPFVRRMVDGEIMGWRFTSGSPDGAAPVPRLAPTASLFPPLAPPPVAPSAPPSGAGGGGAGGGGGEGAGPAIPDLSGLTTTVPVPGDAAEGADAAAGSTTSSAPDATGTSGTDTADGSAADAEELAAQTAGSAGDDGARWLGPAIAVAAAGALTVGAVTRSRRRAQAGS